MLKVYDVLGNSQRLDGGAMFGNAPRAVWSKWCPADEQGRVALRCRTLLADTGQHKLLFETGIGAFFNPKLKDRFGVVESEHVLLNSLAALELSDKDIDFVILSHLHFDHAGGLLAPWQPEAPLELLFPKARFVVSKAAFARAVSPHSRDKASFIPGLVDLLQDSGRLLVADTPAAASAALPAPVEFFETSGHTPGMLHAILKGQHADMVFCADLIPGRPWVHLPITMGYDRFPEQLIDEKAALYERLDLAKTWLFFTHDAEIAASRIARSAERRYDVIESKATFVGGFDLDTAEQQG